LFEQLLPPQQHANKRHQLCPAGGAHLLLLGRKVALDAKLQRRRRVAVDEREHVEPRERGRVL
jgi:hypothetical protein